MLFEKDEAEDFNTLLGINVKWYREQAKLTQKQLGAMLNYSKPWVSNLESAKIGSQISPEIVESIANALNVSSDHLTGSNPQIYREFLLLENMLKSATITPQGMRKFDNMIDASRSLGPRVQAEALRLRGGVEYVLGNYDQALHFYELALKLSKEYKDSKMIFKIQRSISKVYLMRSEYSQALSILSECVSGTANNRERAEDMHLLASIYFQQEKWLQCEEVVLSAINIIRNAFDMRRLYGQCLQILGAVYLFTGRTEASYKTSLEAAELLQSAEDRLGESYALRILGDCLLLNGEKEKAYVHIQRALEILPSGREKEMLEIEFMAAQCNGENEIAFEEMKRVMDIVQNAGLPPRSIAKMYHRLASKSVELGLLHESQMYYEKTIQTLHAVLR